MDGLKFIALSGTTSVTHNLYVYEYKEEMLVVDCGVGFPDIDMRGVDLVLPDFSYIIKNKNKLKGLILSQGHEDHQGALPFLLKSIKTNIYATEIVAAFVQDKLQEHKISGVKINIFDSEKDVLTVGSFKITPFRVSHSIPDTVGFSIDTPEGQVFHVPEHKFDKHPEGGQTFDEEKARRLASKGVLFLASDCLGSNKPGSTKSEESIEENIFKVFKNADQSIFFTTISSNIGRIQQVIDVSQRLGRKVVFVGYSIARKSEIAYELGLLKYKKNQVISLGQAKKMYKDKLVYITAGCYGQVGSSLYRISLNEHPKVHVTEGDMVVFSADPAPPYTKESEDFVIDNLIDLGVDVHYYDLKEGLYVSGHGSQDDIVKLFEIAKPKYLAPIGGTVRFMHGYEKLAVDFGAPLSSIFKLKPGDSVIFKDGNATRGPQVRVKNVFVDGLGIGDVGNIVLRDRKVLSQGGIAIAIIQYDRKRRKLTDTPEVISRGFVFDAKKRSFLSEAGKSLKTHLEKKSGVEKNTIRTSSIEFLENYFFKEIGRRPMILPIIVEIECP